MSNRYAIIENHLVVNVALADEEYAAQQGWTPCPDHVGPNWAYIDGEFIAPIIEITPQPELPPPPTLEELLAQVNQLQSQILLLSGSSNGTA